MAPQTQPSSANLQNPTVRRILKAATRCFARSGYRGASMNAIAKEAGVSKSLVHYHFESKEHLFVSVQLSMLHQIAARIKNLTTISGGPVRGFERGLDEVMLFVETEIESMRVLIEFYNVAATNHEFSKRMEAFDEEVNTLMVEALNETLGAAASSLLIPADRVVRLLRTVFNGLILELAYTAASDEAIARIRETFADCRMILTRAILAPALQSQPQTPTPESLEGDA